jgi:ACS family hexuronate transporter-like MFS transporter
VSAGRIIDGAGVRLGFLCSVSAWSLAAMAHAAVRTVTGFTVARAGLGLAEGGMFPAAIKTVAEWFPKEERAFATGVFNAGSNVGAVICPLVVPWLATHWGWRAAFIATGAVGFLWVAAWLRIYRSPEIHPRVSAAELAHIRKDPPDPAGKIPWLVLLRHRQTWAFVVGMAASSPVWWFYIFWAPDFLNKRYELGLTQSSLPLMIMFLAAGFGGIGGGWLSSRLLKLGWTVNAARKTALLVCALCVVPVMATPFVPDPWLAVALVGLAAAAHCGFAANLFTLVSDTVPKQGVSSVVGIGGMAGALGGMAFAQLVARVLDCTDNNYFVPFAIASLAYLAALAVMHALVPRLERMEVQA